MKPYRVAIVGTGSVVSSHIQALRQAAERVEIVAAVDVEETRVKAFCADNAIPRWFAHTPEMLDTVHPDLVHILTPNGTHFEIAMQCLQAGAWVFCEKPLCASLAQFDQIQEAEVRSGCFVNTVVQWRFGSAAKHLKRLVSSGEMGRPLVGVCQTLWYRALPYYQVPWRGKWATETGGATVTLGIHLIDLFLWLFGDWRELQAINATLDRPIEVENVSMALMRFENGALGSMTTSAVSPRQESYLRLDFQDATVEVKALYRYSNANWTYSIPENSAKQFALKRWQAIEPDIPASHGQELLELLDSMDKGERPAVSGSEARRVIEFIASLYKSVFTRQIVQRGSITPDDPFYYTMNGSIQSTGNT